MELNCWEENIRKQKSKSKNVRGRKAQYPLLKEELLRQFIKRWSFLSKAKKIFWKSIQL